MKRILLVGYLAILAASVAGQEKIELVPDKKYTWAEIQMLDPLQYSRIYIGNYQDYWVSWSPSGTQLIGLAINADFGIHVLDLSTFRFRLNGQRIFVPVELVDQSKSPITWAAKIETKPIQQGFPSWSRDPDLVAYGESAIDYKTAKVVMYRFSTATYETISLPETPKVSGIEFSKTCDWLLAFGEKRLVVYDYVNKQQILKYDFESSIDQAMWISGGKDILVSTNGSALRIKASEKNQDISEILIKGTNWSKIAELDRPGLLVRAGEAGLEVFDTEAEKVVGKLSDGPDYQPQSSFDGKWVTFISEGPYGGFIVPSRNR